MVKPSALTINLLKMLSQPMAARPALRPKTGSALSTGYVARRRHWRLSAAEILKTSGQNRQMKLDYKLGLWKIVVAQELEWIRRMSLLDRISGKTVCL
jgi:hypothetical protein